MVNQSPVIKICGVKSPQLAYETAIAGANYIGLIFHPSSKRYVNANKAAEIAAAIYEGGSKPVGVFVNHHSEQMIEVCQHANINIVQLHGNTARQHGRYLPREIERIYVCRVDSTGKMCDDTNLQQENFHPENDKILFDNIIGGSGKTINYSIIKQEKYNFDFFIAGGLNKKNILTVIKQCSPFGVDLSSGVEISPGEKSLSLIKQIITIIKQSGEQS